MLVCRCEQTNTPQTIMLSQQNFVVLSLKGLWYEIDIVDILQGKGWATHQEQGLWLDDTLIDSSRIYHASSRLVLPVVLNVYDKY